MGRLGKIKPSYPDSQNTQKKWYLNLQLPEITILFK